MHDIILKREVVSMCLFALRKRSNKAVCEWIQKVRFECYFLLRAVPASGWAVELPTDRPATALDASSIVPSIFIDRSKASSGQSYRSK